MPGCVQICNFFFVFLGPGWPECRRKAELAATGGKGQKDYLRQVPAGAETVGTVVDKAKAKLLGALKLALSVVRPNT